MSVANGANGTGHETAKAAEGIRIAAEYRWTHPDATWEETATAAGVHRNTLQTWRASEAWEICFRDAGNAYIEKLAPLAVDALVRSWGKANPNGAIDVLRSFGFLRPDRLEVSAQIGEAEGALIAETIKAAVFQIDLGLTPEQQERLLLAVAERLPS
jgi:hypothetical protein